MWKIKPPLDLPDLTNVTDLNSWLMPVDVSDEDIFSNADIFQSPIDNKTGDALHQASYEICAQQMPECADEMDMLRLMYAQQIRSDCTAYENSLKQQRNASAQKLYTAEQALRSAALEQYQSANKYDLGQCVVEFKNCMIETGGCGSDFSGCASITAFDSTNTRSTNRDLSNTYTIKGSATSIEIQASTYDILLSKKPLCEGITRQCQNVASQVWDTFLREVAPQVKSAELIAEDNARQNCIGNISSCFQQACKDTMDPNDPDGSYDMCLTRPETMLNLCKVPLNACGISEESAPESDIWDFILARLASMRVNSCTTQFKDCLQSEDRCGPDYTQCIGLDTDTIVRMCPYDTLVGCQQKYGETDIRDDAVYDELYNIAQGIFLNIDNNMLTQCQKIADEAMIKVCGDTDNCLGLTVDENLGSRSLEYKICEYSGENDSMDINYANCRTDVSQITDDELGRSPGIDPATGERIPGTIKPLAGVIDGIIYWESVEINEDGRLISVDEYLDKIGEADAPENQREMISSELAVLQRNIDTAINAIESDPNVQYCMNGREVDGIETIVDRAGNTGQVRGRFPALTTQMRMIIANAALKAAKDNYYAKYDELTERLQQDYVTIGERIAEIHGENAKDSRREMAREACVNFAELSSLPKSAEPPKSAGGAIVATLALAAGAIAAPFTVGLSTGAVLTTILVESAMLVTAGASLGVGYSGGSANGADGAGQLDLTGSKSVNQWNYKETITTTFDWENLVCHKCTRTQQCTKTGNPLFGNKYCKTWADPVETCSDTQF